MFRYSLYAKPHLSKGLLSASPCVTTVGYIPDNTGIAGPSRGPYHVAPTGGGYTGCVTFGRHSPASPWFYK